MVTKEELDKIHQSVPVDYYQKGIDKNLLQRYWHKRRFKLIEKEFTKLGLTGKILDIGCHSGDLTNELQKITECEVYGIDISEKAINYAKSRFPQINFIAGDFPSGSNFEKNYFQAVTTFDVMEHIPNTDGVMEEVKNILTPNGYFVMAIPNENLLFKIVWFLWIRMKGEVWDDSHVHDFKKEGFDVLTNKGFKKVVDKKIIGNMWHFIIFKLDK